ncbi:MAG: hypothetical protein ABJH98_02170 [Reichenbachiella sp.]|uniref:hypothetical protein n=1 Tax=Reichenbachiella sp. TaxID=2184521 RepID=UPI0032993E7D
MKFTLIFTISISLLFSNCDDKDELPEKIYEGEVNLLTQEDVDEFGSEGYTRIAGNLNIGIFIEPTTEIINIDALSSLRVVDDNLRISSNINLKNIDGLENLKSVGWSLIILDNASLENVSGLKSLSFVRNDFDISGNTLITSLDGLQNWNSKTTGLDIFINSNSNLTIFCALEGILRNNELSELYISGNPYNPTRQKILSGKCSE